MKARQKEALIKLAQQGIQWRHFRPRMRNVEGTRHRKLVRTYESLRDRVDYFNKGGATIAFVQLGDGRWRWAISECSVKDNFEKATGRFIAAQRLNSEQFSDVTVEAMSEDNFREFIENVLYFHILSDQGFNTIPDTVQS